MNESDFCCIKQVTKSISVTIPLKYITNEIAAVSEILEGWKRQYVPKLQGVLVNYRNIRLSTGTVAVHSSRTAPKCIITATFDLFCPTIGEIVKGTINRFSREHIGCLIEGTINVSIHRKKNSPQELSKFLKINHPILFEIENFFYDRQTIRVKGHITSECVELMKEVFPHAHSAVNGSSKDESALSDDLFGNTESLAEEVYSNLDNFVELKDNSLATFEETLTSDVESPKKKLKKRELEVDSPRPKQSKKLKLSDPNLSPTASNHNVLVEEQKVNKLIESPKNKTQKRKRESESSPVNDKMGKKKLKLSDSRVSHDSSDPKDILSDLLTTHEVSPSKTPSKSPSKRIEKSDSDSSNSSSSDGSSDLNEIGLSSNALNIKQESPQNRELKKSKNKSGSSNKKKKDKSSDGKKSRKEKKKGDKLKLKKKSKVSATGEVLKKDKKKSKKGKKDKKKDKTKKKKKHVEIKSELD